VIDILSGRPEIFCPGMFLPKDQFGNVPFPYIFHLLALR